MLLKTPELVQELLAGFDEDRSLAGAKGVERVDGRAAQRAPSGEDWPADSLANRPVDPVNAARPGLAIGVPPGADLVDQ